DAAGQDQRLGDSRGRHGEAPAGGQVIELVDGVAAFRDGIAVAVFGLDEYPPLRCPVGGVPVAAVQLYLRAIGRGPVRVVEAQGVALGVQVRVEDLGPL